MTLLRRVWAHAEICSKNRVLLLLFRKTKLPADCKAWRSSNWEYDQTPSEKPLKLSPETQELVCKLCTAKACKAYTVSLALFKGSELYPQLSQLNSFRFFNIKKIENLSSSLMLHRWGSPTIKAPFLKKNAGKFAQSFQ